MASTATRITADEYYALTVERDRKQLVGGEIIVNEPKPIHAQLQGRLYRALMDWVDGAPGRGMAFLPTDLRLDEHNVYGPDLLWFAGGHVPEDLYVYPERAPDLCVEIRSPGTWRYDIGAKKAAYERSALPELWLVDDRSETVLAYRRSTPEAAEFDETLELALGDIFASPLLAGFSLSVRRLFA